MTRGRVERELPGCWLKYSRACRLQKQPTKVRSGAGLLILQTDRFPQTVHFKAGLMGLLHIDATVPQGWARVHDVP
jgi:hypothetical protein